MASWLRMAFALDQIAREPCLKQVRISIANLGLPRRAYHPNGTTRLSNISFVQVNPALPVQTGVATTP